MGEVLTIEEIYARYPDEWVLIDQPESDEYQRVRRGKVVFHSPDRDAVDAKSLELPVPRHAAVRFTGKPKPGHVLIL
jgi:hypothetical protein